MHAQSLSRVELFTNPWTVAHQAPLFMEISRQEYWSGLPFPSQQIYWCSYISFYIYPVSSHYNL